MAHSCGKPRSAFFVVVLFVANGVAKEKLMLPDLELLLKLQVIDYDLGELERSKEYLPDMMDNLRREIEETNQTAESAGEELQQSQLLKSELELQVKTHETDLQRYQQQMMSIKTNTCWE